MLSNSFIWKGRRFLIHLYVENVSVAKYCKKLSCRNIIEICKELMYNREQWIKLELYPNTRLSIAGWCQQILDKLTGWVSLNISSNSYLQKSQQIKFQNIHTASSSNVQIFLWEFGRYTIWQRSCWQSCERTSPFYGYRGGVHSVLPGCMKLVTTLIYQ